MTKANHDPREITEARDLLERWLPVGTEVHAITIGYTGTSQTYRFLVARDGRVEDITGYVSVALDRKRLKNGALRRSGGGMDLANELVMQLSKALHGDDRALNYRRS